MSQIFEPGTAAPAFDLPSSLGGRISKDDLAGQTCVLVFYPGDFTPVCTSELALFEQARSEIEASGARLFGISVDSIASHEAFARAQKLGFALLSDSHPKGAVSQAFRSYNQDHGYSSRALFVIDGQGRIVWSQMSPDGVNPGVDGVLRALSDMGAGKGQAHATRDDFHARGPAGAAVTLTEYGDYQCPYCGQAYHELKKVFAHFGDRLRFEFRNFPLANIHPYAELAAEVAEAAGAQDKFWPMHDAIYENQAALSEDMLVELARELGLDVDRLVAEVNAHDYRARIRTDLSEGLRAGVNGTPSFFINGRLHQASFDARTLIRAIEEAGQDAGQ